MDRREAALAVEAPPEDFIYRKRAPVTVYSDSESRGGMLLQKGLNPFANPFQRGLGKSVRGAGGDSEQRHKISPKLGLEQGQEARETSLPPPPGETNAVRTHCTWLTLGPDGLMSWPWNGPPARTASCAGFR